MSAREGATDGDCEDPCFARRPGGPFGDGADLLTYGSICQPQRR